jgi:hypothetical protein
MIWRCVELCEVLEMWLGGWLKSLFSSRSSATIVDI